MALLPKKLLCTCITTLSVHLGCYHDCQTVKESVHNEQYDEAMDGVGNGCMGRGGKQWVERGNLH